MVIQGPSRYGERFLNSIIIGFGSTFLSIVLGTLAAYAFGRFKVREFKALAQSVEETRQVA